jgi:quercetin dioxygenase-like cupin family protein
VCVVDRSDLRTVPLAWAVAPGSTGDPAWAYEVDLAVGEGTGAHLHPSDDVVILVVDGELEHRTDDRTVLVGAGDAVFVERATTHSANAPSVPTRILVMLGPHEPG